VETWWDHLSKSKTRQPFHPQFIKGASKNVPQGSWIPGSLMQFLALNLVPRSLTGTFLETPCIEKGPSEIPVNFLLSLCQCISAAIRMKLHTWRWKLYLEMQKELAQTLYVYSQEVLPCEWLIVKVVYHICWARRYTRLGLTSTVPGSNVTSWRWRRGTVWFE
jgi:hypothetical protein